MERSCPKTALKKDVKSVWLSKTLLRKGYLKYPLSAQADKKQREDYGKEGKEQVNKGEQ